MAAGSSAPELATSLADVLVSQAKEQIGVGTIVGSAVYNLVSFNFFCVFLEVMFLEVVIPAASAALAGSTLR